MHIVFHTRCVIEGRISINTIDELLNNKIMILI